MIEGKTKGGGCGYGVGIVLLIYNTSPLMNRRNAALPLCLRGWNWELRELPCCHATCPLCKLKWAWRRIKKKNILFQSRDSFSIDLCCVWGLCGLSAGINLFVIQVMKKKMKKTVRESSDARLLISSNYSSLPLLLNRPCHQLGPWSNPSARHQ